MNRYIVSAVALMASAGIAFAQSPKGQEGSSPSAQSAPSGQASPGGSSGSNSAGSSKSVAPGQVKEQGSSAEETAPGRTKTQNRVDSGDKGSEGTKSKSKSSQRDDATDSKRSRNADRDDANKGAKSADRNERDKNGKSAERNGADKDMKSSSGPRNGDAKRAGKEGGGKSGAAAEVQLKPEQKTKVVTTFKRHRVEPARNININVSVGTVVPRKVHLHPIPQDIVVIVPQYRSYKYFVFDDRVIIVEPATYEIVEVLVLA